MFLKDRGSVPRVSMMVLNRLRERADEGFSRPVAKRMFKWSSGCRTESPAQHDWRHFGNRERLIAASTGAVRGRVWCGGALPNR